MKKLLLLFFAFYASHLAAQTLPSQFSRVLVDNGISSPTAFAFAPDGRIFVTQQTGQLRVIKNGSLLTTNAIALTVTSDGERGLIGIAVDPDFTNNKYVYLYYTVPADTERTAAFNKIVRYTFDGDVLLSSSAQTILELNDLSAAHTNHNGGSMNFGPDGKLYVGVGENATGGNAQNLDNYLGKLLRINADGSVPPNNPFTGNDAKSRIWAYGLRNPYSFSFDRLSGKLFINDVGESTWEEINEVTGGGLNFGWPTKEGFCTSNCDGFTDPLYAYAHGDNTDGKGCAIIGGTFFNPITTNYPSTYSGQYFFSDLCGQWINSIDPASPSQRNAFATAIGGSPTYLLTNPDDGKLYYLSRDDQSLYKIEYSSTTAVTDPIKNEVLTVSPNPSSGRMKIAYVVKENDALNVSVRNAQGEAVIEDYAMASGEEIDLSSYPSGLYLVVVKGYSGIRVIKE
ncbi:MAG: carbohydrate-binding protein [Chitinophagaceae bacterium]|nr:carbohydrate-binding protein [Chitinophagaceae bacterium]